MSKICSAGMWKSTTPKVWFVTKNV